MTFAAYDVLALVCGLCMVLKMSKKGYKWLGMALLIATAWGAIVQPAYRAMRSKARALTSVVSPMVSYSQDEIQAMLITEAGMQGVDPAIVLAFSECETQHRDLVGDGGLSVGPLQVNTRWHSVSNPRDVRETISKGVSILRDRLERYQGNVVSARLAYVCGTPEGCSPGKAQTVKAKLLQAADMYGLSL